MSTFKEIKIGGRLRAFRFGVWNVGELLAHFDMDMQSFGNHWVKNPFQTVPTILFYGHKFECERRGEPIDFTIQDFAEWLEGFENTVANEEINSVLMCLSECLLSMFPKATEEGKPEKKSSIKKVS